MKKLLFLLVIVSLSSCSSKSGHIQQVREKPAMHKVKVKNTIYHASSIVIVDTMFHVGDTLINDGAGGLRVIVQE